MPPPSAEMSVGATSHEIYGHRLKPRESSRSCCEDDSHVGATSCLDSKN